MRGTAQTAMDQVLAYLQRVAQSRNVTLPADGESLFDADVLDSFGALELVVFVEEELSMTVPDEDLGVGHFQSIARIRAYLDRRANE
jgi:acyl carrier protein